MTRVAFIGLGNMGSGMAVNQAKAGRAHILGDMVQPHQRGPADGVENAGAGAWNGRGHQLGSRGRLEKWTGTSAHTETRLPFLRPGVKRRSRAPAMAAASNA